MKRMADPRPDALPRAETSGAERAGAVLTVDLDALADNWRDLGRRAAPAICAAVVKADAYGLGALAVTRALAAAGCRDYFVSSIDEGIAVRSALGAPSALAGRPMRVFVLSGLARGALGDFARHDLVPVLLSPDEVARWAGYCASHGRLAAGIKIDTGMTRLGMDEAAFRALAGDGTLARLPVALVMSHLACADEPAHPLNEDQRTRFAALARLLPGVPASLANSAGIFLGAPYCADMVRPGAALYGLAARADAPNPMRQVVHLKAKILQVRVVDSPRSVGYGAAGRAGAGSRLATVAVGYADGFMRRLGDGGGGHVGDCLVPLVGRVSMDLSTFDVTAAPEAATRTGDYIDLISPRQTVDDLARAAGTIGYEVLTRLARRIHRLYLGGG
ncbi:MAG: alanine racemase [Alphaproteobacteria bacterium]|nr:alanine racemase [Alphaproteobacteria bacterium]